MIREKVDYMRDFEIIKTDNPNEPEYFYTSRGVKVVLMNSPSQEACKNFVRTVLAVNAKYSNKDQ